MSRGAMRQSICRCCLDREATRALGCLRDARSPRPGSAARRRSRSDTDAGAPGHFGRDQARARTEKRVIDQLAGPTVVEDRTAHALDRLLRAVSPALLALSITERIVVGDLPHGGLLAVTLPLASLALAHRVPAIFMTPMVVAAAQYKMLLDPDDLRPRLQ